MRAAVDLSNNPTQRDFVLSRHTRTSFYGGIRNGKTVGGCARVLLFADIWPGNKILVCRKTYQELRDTTWSVLLDMVRLRNGGNLKPGPYVARYRDNPAMEIELRNGSLILGRYADNPESILSLTLGGAYLDQAEYINEEVYEHIESRVNIWTPQKIAETEFPDLGMDMGPPRGMVWISGNPAPGWVHRRWKLGLTADGRPMPPGEYEMFEASSSANAMNLPPEYLQSLLVTHTQAWIDRFVTGDWTTHEGQIYSDYQDGLHGISLHELPWSRPPLAWPRYLGWDHGQRNPTAVIFLAHDPESDCSIAYNEHYKISKLLEEHAKDVQDLSEGDSVPRASDGKGIIVHMDSATFGDYSEEGINFKELYSRLGIHGLAANKSVNAGIQAVSAMLRPDPKRPFPSWHPRAGQLGSPQLFFLREQTRSLRHELPLYEWEPAKAGMPPSEKPKKYLDHALDAMRYAIMGMRPAEKKQPAAKVPTYGEWVKAKILSEFNDEVTPKTEVDRIWG